MALAFWYVYGDRVEAPKLVANHPQTDIMMPRLATATP